MAREVLEPEGAPPALAGWALQRHSGQASWELTWAPQNRHDAMLRRSSTLNDAEDGFVGACVSDACCRGV